MSTNKHMTVLLFWKKMELNVKSININITLCTHLRKMKRRKVRISIFHLVKQAQKIYV